MACRILFSVTRDFGVKAFQILRDIECLSKYCICIATFACSLSEVSLLEAELQIVQYCVGGGPAYEVLPLMSKCKFVLTTACYVLIVKSCGRSSYGIFKFVVSKTVPSA
jgi:hypothetical protein